MSDLLRFLSCSALIASAQHNASPTLTACIQKASHHLTYGLYTDEEGCGKKKILKKMNRMLTTQVQKQRVLSEQMLLREVVQQCHHFFFPCCCISPLEDSPEKSTTASAVKPS